MRLTREYLQNTAKEMVAERVRREHNLLAVYLCGSLLDEEPLLGESSDIDLVFIHYEEPYRGRETVRLNDQIHMDILHHEMTIYSQPRQLRQHPWLGPAVYRCKVLHDPQHFMDFTVAGVRGQFDLADNVYRRALTQVLLARRTWQGLAALNTTQDHAANSAAMIWRYLAVLENSANAVVSLTARPLAERRFLLEFPACAQRAGAGGLAIGLLGLLGAMNLEKRLLENWLPAWEAAFRSISTDPDVPAEISAPRFGYYQSGITALLESRQPASALWPLLRTWTRLAGTLALDDPRLQDWQNVCSYLSLAGEDFQQRILALDSYLDTIEELIEDWGKEHGALS